MGGAGKCETWPVIIINLTCIRTVHFFKLIIYDHESFLNTFES